MDTNLPQQPNQNVNQPTPQIQKQPSQQPEIPPRSFSKNKYSPRALTFSIIALILSIISLIYWELNRNPSTEHLFYDLEYTEIYSIPYSLAWFFILVFTAYLIYKGWKMDKSEIGRMSKNIKIALFLYISGIIPWVFIISFYTYYVFVLSGGFGLFL